MPFPSPGGLPDPGIEPGSPALQADSLPTELPGKPRFSFFWQTIFEILELLILRLNLFKANLRLGYDDQSV